MNRGRQEELSEESDGEAICSFVQLHFTFPKTHFASDSHPVRQSLAQGEQITVEELEQWKETLAEEDSAGLDPSEAEVGRCRHDSSRVQEKREQMEKEEQAPPSHLAAAVCFVPRISRGNFRECQERIAREEDRRRREAEEARTAQMMAQHGVTQISQEAMTL